MIYWVLFKLIFIINMFMKNNDILIFIILQHYYKKEIKERNVFYEYIFYTYI